MKKIIFFILALAQVFIVYPQATSGTQVTAPIVPNDSSDVYPTHDAFFGRDGYRSVSSITERNNIKTDYRKPGMLVYVQSDSSYYQLRNGVTNDYWFKPIPIIDTTSEWVARTIYVSMPTDPQTPGSDVTGTGSISLPYATLEKALSTIKTNGIFAPVTVQLDSGTFNYTPKCRAYLLRLCTKIFGVNITNPIFTIKGQFAKETLYPTLTWTAKTIPFVYTVSGYAFAENELADKFCGNTGGTFWLPIEGNRNDTVIPATTSIGAFTFIYRANTTLALTTDLYDLSFIGGIPFQIYLSNFKITSSTSKYLIGLTATHCLFDFTGNSFVGLDDARLFYSKIKSDPTNTGYAVITHAGTNEISASIIYKKNTRKTVGNGIYHNRPCVYSPIIISGFLYGFTFANSNDIPPYSSANNILIKDCTNALANNLISDAIITSTSEKISTLFTDYLLYTFASNVPVRFSTTSFLTNKLISIYNPSSLYKSFVREDLGGYINGLGLYTEVQRKLTATLVNNTTDSISIGDKSYNRTIELKYTALRGSTYRKGTLEIINTGSGLTFNPGSYFPVTDIGLTFTGAYYSGSSNTIKLKYTVDNSGGNVTLTYDAFRQNY